MNFEVDFYIHLLILFSQFHQEIIPQGNDFSIRDPPQIRTQPGFFIVYLYKPNERRCASDEKLHES